MPVTMASVSFATPVSVVKVVSSTLVCATYRRVTVYSPTGESSMHPPEDSSTIRANTGREWMFGSGSQSTAPSSPMSATVRPSPIAA